MRTPSVLLVLALANAVTVLASRVPTIDGLQSELDKRENPVSCMKDKDCKRNPALKDWTQPQCREKICRDKCQEDMQCQAWAKHSELKICPPDYPPTPEEAKATGERCTFCSPGPDFKGYCVSALTLPPPNEN
ncbi:hypothetical protein BKA65DRAFT_471262 [Rhexocercosporidium sp. MPI-PUGE-AT-0058]|nr:hypothetical protein BKA65DRAFT_471262 [Rhexocercosporidium sp. MPI-PUGE-AT-0058]